MSKTINAGSGASWYPWLETDWQKLVQYAESNQVPHALAITGSRGIGKSNLALRFANFLLCDAPKASRRPCGQCDACGWIEAGTHPDLIRIEPAEPGKTITIDSIRDLIEKLSLSAQYHKYRIVIISPADRLNSASANALLKTLEEPGLGTVLILLTARYADLPATIRSRCQRLDVALPDPMLATDWLAKDLPESDAEILLSMAGGAPLKARVFWTDGSLERRNTLFDRWREIAEKRVDPVGIAETLASFPAEETLRWICSWTIDIIRLSMAPSTGFLNSPDLRPALQAEAQKLDLQELFRFYDQLLEAASMLGSPVNVRMLLESILVEWYSMRRFF